MVGILQLAPDQMEPHWREMGRLWRGDAARRRHSRQLEDARRASILGQCEVWIAWDDEPTDVSAYGGPHYCLGIVLVCRLPGTAWITFAAGKFLEKWSEPMLDAILTEAESGTRFHVYCRKGWLQVLRPHLDWLERQDLLRFHRDPEVLFMEPHALLGATA